jgi:tetratricopeptide (TPR) repeat protein
MGGFFILGVGLVGMTTTGLLAGSSGQSITTTGASAGAPAYPAAPAPGSLAEPAPSPRIVVRPGILLDDSERMRNFEAILRLHTWLGLRDLRTGQASIDWVPAIVADDADPFVDSDCEGGLAATLGGRLDSPPAVPATAANPRRTLIIRLALTLEGDDLRIEAFGCNPGGRIHRQVITDSPDRFGRAQRELLAWLASRLGVADTLSWEDDWGRDPAPAGPVLTGYGRALRRSMGEPGVPPAALSEAALSLPEAAWLAGRLSEDPGVARRHLERAASLRVGFTAALEDLAALLVAQDRTDLAEAAIERLRRTGPGARAVEWGLAWTLLERDRPADAAKVLRHLPKWLVAEETTARLWSATLAGLGRNQEALRWVDTWIESDPQSGSAQLLRGRILAGLHQEEPTAVAYAKAAELDPDLREVALRRWALVRFASGGNAEVARRLNEETWVAERPALLELRAFAAFRAGDPAAAVRDYLLLIELQPDEVRHRMNRCAASLAAGLVPATPDPCAGLPSDQATANLLEAAALSRIPERTIEQFLELMDRAELAGREAPLDPVAADAVLQIAGPFRDDDERARLRGMWRLAVGGERRLTASEKPEEGTEDLRP